MSDATIINERPPLYACYSPIGQQTQVPSDSHQERRVVFGALNVSSGHLELLITRTWEAITWQWFLHQIRKAWRGWYIVLFLDRGSPHRAAASKQLARKLNIELRWLPTATPELNAVESLWQDGKAKRLANKVSDTVDDAADAFCQYLLELRPDQRLKTAGILSGNFWLTKNMANNFYVPT